MRPAHHHHQQIVSKHTSKTTWFAHKKRGEFASNNTMTPQMCWAVMQQIEMGTISMVVKTRMSWDVGTLGHMIIVAVSCCLFVCCICFLVPFVCLLYLFSFFFSCASCPELIWCTVAQAEWKQKVAVYASSALAKSGGGSTRQYSANWSKFL